jgi:NADPH:quinone reductase-like Zn-dependent oxidoreductase
LKAVVFQKHGSPEVLEIDEVPKPKIKDDEVLVKVLATSVNPVDTLFRSNRLMSFFMNRGIKIPGSDLSGKIESVGKNVKLLKKDDEVYGFSLGGATAEYAAISEKKVAIKPANMTFEQAAAVPLAGLTAYQAFRYLGKIHQGQKVLINGASGGVGTYAVQIAKSYATEITGVTSTTNLEMVKSIGAEKTFDYTKTDFTETSQRYDIILDAVAKNTFSKCKKILNPGGIFISTRIGPSLLLQIFLTSLYGSKKAKTTRVNSNTKDLDTLRELVEAGKITSIIEKSYTMSQAADAHSHVETERTKGKVVIAI